MQNKGAIRAIAILFALICVYQLSFTIVTRQVEKKARHYANNEQVITQAKELALGDAAREKQVIDSITEERYQHYVDSVSNQVCYNILIRKYTYKECKEREINLGLDLRGGMNVMMEVSTSDVVKALSGYSKDPVFNQVMEQAIAKNKVTPNSDFVTIFAETWKSVDANAQMAAIFSWTMKNDINANSSNDEVVKALRVQTKDAFDRTYQILRQRIDRFGVAQPNIQKLEQTERILIELPGVKDPKRVRKLLQGTAQLEFWETYEYRELAPNLEEANQYLASLNNISQDSLMNSNDNADATNAAKKADTASADDALIDQVAGSETGATDVDRDQLLRDNPLYAVLNPSLGAEDANRPGPVIGYALAKDIPTVNRLLALAVKKFPSNVKFVWSVKPISPQTDIYQLIALKVNNSEGRAPLTGDVVTDARQDFGQSGGVEISMSMNSEGAKIWKRMTASNIGRAIAVVLDDYAYSWPNVNTEIPNGSSVISGGFSVEEGKDLANVLKAGKLPAPARIVQEAVVGPSLGQQAIESGLISFILAFVMVLLYMLFFYNRAGIVANVALLTNVFFIFGVLASLGAVLTLPGIAGIVLTLGMAVDANVIIYERIKDELRSGKGMKMAIDDGYKNAYSAIIDGNVTTLLTAVVLYVFGSGPIQGFATTLIIGILTSLFTAIFITRLVIMMMMTKKWTLNFDNKYTRNFLAYTKFDILGKRKISYALSSILVLLSIITLVTKGMNLGIDFKGGRTYVVRFDRQVDVQEARNAFGGAFGETPEVKTFGPSNQLKVTTKYMIAETGEEVDAEVEKRLYEGAKALYKTPITEADFLSETVDKELGKLSSEMVGPTMATDITRSAFLAVCIALLVIFAYIAVRFKRWQFGLGGTVALLHNTIITLGVFSIFSGLLPFSMEVDQAFIAAILTVIGYAINDTVIIFDRIREFMGLYPKHPLKNQMNDAFNSTLSRTVNTSGTTLIVLVMIFIFGGEVIRGFTFALMFGIIIGTYSSLFVASPIAYDLMRRQNNKRLAAAKK